MSFFSFLRRPAPEVRILVTGCRGKSSLVRLITTGLLAGGRRALGRITGVIPREIGPEGERQILRASGAHITEMRWWLGSLPAGTDSVVLENSAVSPDFQEAAARWLDPTLLVFTNVREDHRESWGAGIDNAARVLVRGLAPALPVVMPSGTAEHPIVSDVVARIGCQLVRVPENPDFREGNFELALAACDRVGCRGDGVAFAMRTLKPDVADFRVFPLDGGELAYAFSANDVESTMRLFESLGWLPEETTLLYNARGDRPGRDAAFARLFAEKRWKEIVRIDSQRAGRENGVALLRFISEKGRVFGCGNVAGAPLRFLSLLNGRDQG